MIESKLLRPEIVMENELLDKKELREDLAKTFRIAKELKIPTVILFEGWGASGKGYMINKLISELDPARLQGVQHQGRDRGGAPLSNAPQILGKTAEQW